jgi:hypothetical protein
MINTPIREKRHRLGFEIYKVERPISFTLCVKNKDDFFTENNQFKIFEKILLNE